MSSIITRAVRKVKNALRPADRPVYIPVLSGELLKGKTILVTGATGGIGTALVKACLANGASVIAAGRNEQKVAALLEQLAPEAKDPQQRLLPMILDIGRAGAIRDTFRAFTEGSPVRIDALINNAGTLGGPGFGRTSEEDYDLALDVNLKGTYFMCQAFAEYLIAQKIEGNILNISSSSAVRPAISPYMLSKRGIDGLTEGLAKKLIRHGIVVNGLAPGPTATEMVGRDGSDLFHGRSPAGRCADPAEVANLAVVLISPLGRMVVGDTVYVTGGCGNLTVDDIAY